ncbi:MAG: DUF3793 family protein [Lachnospiraceae bacterium]|nr:DUF3793 family protein [Lachnospiraceae bacterium]
MLEKYLVEYCAPTLASLKPANLFSLNLSEEPELYSQIERVNQWLDKKGLLLMELCRRGNKALLYLCRKSHLRRELEADAIGSFLSRYGYQNMELEHALERLKSRLAESEEFPHEIGVFLGYPLGDVIGFIENEGRNCKCSGCWKVYDNECEAKQLFARFARCRNVYTKLWNAGWSIRKLTVAV